MSNTAISHKGIVESILNDIVTVNITCVSACTSCHAKDACNSSDSKDKKIEVTLGDKQLKIGELVTVTAMRSMGLKAVFLGYILPFMLVITSLIIGNAYAINESASGGISLAILIPYYFILYLFKNRLKKSFVFQIEQ